MSLILSQLNPFHTLSTELLKTHFNIILPPMTRFLSLSYPQITLSASLLSPYVPRAFPISFLVIWSFEKYLLRVQTIKFLSVKFPSPFLFRLPSSALYSRSHSAYVLPTMWETKYRTHVLYNMVECRTISQK